MRRRRAERREVAADLKHNSKIISKFINMIMYRGKKTVAEKIVYNALDLLKQRTKEEDALKVFHKAVDNVRPKLEVKPRRVGGATYQIPIEVNQARGISLALRWISDFARSRKGKPMFERLADELFAAYKGEGPAVKKRDDTHKMAEANKAFSHFKW